MERSYGPFRRTFDLGLPVDSESISASFEQGTLRVHIPKLPAGATQVTIGGEEH
jgi:HSP20 family molecular chaperone IbpA